MTGQARDKAPAATEAPFEAVASRASWRSATMLAFAALACALLLGGLSAWFLGAVAIAGLSTAALTFNFHIPGALVRLFAIGRTAAKYGERLAGHKAALTDQVARRVQVFRGMAASPLTRAAGWQFGDQSRLTDYLDDVEDIDFGRLRVDLPLMTLGFGLASLIVATLVVAPLAVPFIILVLLAILITGRWVARTGAMALDRIRTLQRSGAQTLGAAMASAVPLHGEGGWDVLSDDAFGAFGKADRERAGLRARQALLDTIVSLAGPGAALAVIGGAWLGGMEGAALLVPVFVAFAWIAFGEALNGASRILVAQIRRRQAAAEIAAWMGARMTPARTEPAGQRITRLTAASLHRRAPDGRELGQPVDLRLEAGRPVVLVGASGSGKTSLLKQVAGWIGNDAMTAGSAVIAPQDRRGMACLCLHDAAILSDTVRANLFAPNASDDELNAALAAVEMADRVEAEGGLDAWVTQASFSLGETQRLNLARAWLSRKPVVLLDEPTEHLDDMQGARILARFARHLKDRIVVMSSHRGASLPDSVTIGL